MAKYEVNIVYIITVIYLIIYNCQLCTADDEKEKAHKTEIKNKYDNVEVAGKNAGEASTKMPAGASIEGVKHMTTPPSIVVPYINDQHQHLLGVNGSGQLKNLLHNATISLPISTISNGGVEHDTSQNSLKIINENGSINTTDDNMSSKMNSSDEKVADHVVKPTELSYLDDRDRIIASIDVPKNQTLKELKKHNITINEKIDHHNYYNSSMYVSKEEVSTTWEQIKNIEKIVMLSNSHRRAMTVHLSFDFPFYGNPIRNVTVATGGFIYTGDYVHSWLAATQFIAPLMANFDTSVSNASFVRQSDNGTSFTVLWENVYLQDKKDVGMFTFSATLHKSGDIVFTYFNVPIYIDAIQDDKHPVKVGLSDAYIIDKVIAYARRKTIYEYHRVNFPDMKIVNSTIIRLTALPTCLEYTDCESCINHFTVFDCSWCPALKRCSTGTDRRRQEWLSKGCDRSPIKSAEVCMAIADDKKSNTNITTLTKTNNSHAILHEVVKPYLRKDDIDDQHLLATQAQQYHKASNLNSNSNLDSVVSKEVNQMPSVSKSMNLTLSLFVPICFIACILLWVLYAYRNPHTKSGQLLIQYRPSQWSWRRGEARYTAATIHM